MADQPTRFLALRQETNDVIERLLHDIYVGGEWNDEHEDLLDEWRAARGDRAKDHWNWWVGGVGDESFAYEASTRDEVLAIGRREYHQEGTFEICEARGWNDNVKEGEEITPFADMRHKEIITIAANDRESADG